jgi:spoIIIJ-associated protein
MNPEGSIFEGKTLDDAVRKGLEALRLSRAEVMITMIEEGSGGFLGLGARPYRVRVMPRPGGAIPEPLERGDRERGGRRESGRPRPGARRGRPAQGARRSEEPAAGQRGRYEQRRRGGAEPTGPRSHIRHRGERTEEFGARPPIGESTPEGESARGGDRDRDRGRRRRRRRNGGRPGETRERTGNEGMTATRPAPSATDRMGGQEHHAAAEAVREREREPRTGVAAEAAPVLSPEALAAEGRRLTEELMRHMGFEATVTATADEESRVDVTVEVHDGEELLTGRRGEVRQALQHVLNLMLNRGGRGYHLQLEINEFWKQRETELVEMARRLAEEALVSGSEAVSEYLNAQERRILHVTLREDTRVKTYALGTGLIKRVAVAPADFPSDEESAE